MDRINNLKRKRSELETARSDLDLNISQLSQTIQDLERKEECQIFLNSFSPSFSIIQNFLISFLPNVLCQLIFDYTNEDWIHVLLRKSKLAQYLQSVPNFTFNELNLIRDLPSKDWIYQFAKGDDRSSHMLFLPDSRGGLCPWTSCFFAFPNAKNPFGLSYKKKCIPNKINVSLHFNCYDVGYIRSTMTQQSGTNHTHHLIPARDLFLVYSRNTFEIIQSMK